jgi:hypothetical protein
MTASIYNLDQSGNTAQFVRTYLGPSIGWVILPVAPETDVTSTAPYTVQPFDARIVLKAACKLIQLPSVSAWVQANNLTNVSGFERSLSIKDMAGLASSGAPIVVTPSGTDTIDGLASYKIISPYQVLRLYPITATLGGWFVG